MTCKKVASGHKTAHAESLETERLNPYAMLVKRIASNPRRSSQVRDSTPKKCYPLHYSKLGHYLIRI